MALRARSLSRHLAIGFVGAPIVLGLACGGTEASSSSTTSHDAAASANDEAAADDADTISADGAISVNDAAPAARNSACTPLSKQTGSAVNSSYGRLDGTLVYVVGVGQGRACNGDDSHVHLQVEVTGNVYDVAVDVGTTDDEVGLLEQSITVPGGVWEEGWHAADTLAYPATGIHSSSLALTSPSAVGSQLTTLLESASKISIFCTGYAQGNGCHDVHYKDGSGNDGAIVISPTAADSPTIFLRFSTQSF